MVDIELAKRWMTTEALLERARHALPDAYPQHQQQSTALLADYTHYLDHNELGLAFDALEQLGRLVAPRGGFWRDLERAAENMGLTDRLPALRQAFNSAAIPEQK